MIYSDSIDTIQTSSTARQVGLRVLNGCLLALAGLTAAPAFSAPLNLSQTPLFLTPGQPPLVLLTMARDHKLYYEAYNDYSDLDDDGYLDVGYKPSINYYGYFDSFKCYTHASGLFSPSTVTANKKCTGKWSGDFLNYVTMARIDALRKVLYGGKRSTDTATQTILERTFIPQDAHSWGKEYQSVARDGYNIAEYTPLALPAAGRYHLFANTTLTSDTSPPLMRVLTNTNYRVWEWLSIERPVAGTECATGNNSRANCAVAGGTKWEVIPSSFFPGGLSQVFYNTKIGSASAPSNAGSRSDFDNLISTYAGSATNRCGTQAVSQINGSTNPFAGTSPCLSEGGAGNGQYYIDVTTGTIMIPEDGTYKFAVNGDDAVDVFIDGTLVVGWYGGHGADGSDAGLLSHSADRTLTAGAHTVVFRHQESTGGESYYLNWQRVLPTSAMTDYAVRVEVCNATVGLEPSCQAYGSSNKPVGLLQRQGENESMYFGLLTGSYAHNTEGGVMRKAMSSINNEIMANGRFGATTDDCSSGTKCVNGIISTINKFKITGFSYSDYQYTCGRFDTSQIVDGQCNMWGNPIGEMAYEGMRYFAGKTAPTSTFTYSSSDNTLDDNVLGLPQLTSWTNPYSATPDLSAATPTFAACSKPYTMLISDVYPSFDSNSVPGNPFTTFAGDVPGLNVNALGQFIWTNEEGLGGAKNIFIGQSGTTSDGAPTIKSASSFGNIRGLSPGEPTRQGSYYAAAIAYYAHINDINPVAGDQKLNTYSIALAAPLPKLEIPVGNNKITIVPFAKSVGGNGISSASNAFQSTNQIVDFYVDTIRNVPGSPTDATVNGGRPYYKFRINYEDVEQGADHDMDAVAMYEIKRNDDNTVSVKISSDYAAGGIIQHMGFTISGTTKDRAYLVVRDTDTDAASDPAYFLDCRSNTTNPDDCAVGTGALPLAKELIFTASDTPATQLKDPLWYAAKWGSFTDKNANKIPDTTEWSAAYSATAENTPDNYFLVTNALKLEAQLTKAFGQIKDDTATAAATSTNSFSYQDDSALYQARFSSKGWMGELNAYPIKIDGSLGPADWQAQSKLATTASTSRAILTYDRDAATKGIPFQWASMTSAGTPYMRTSLNKNYVGTVDNLGSDRVSYLRGNAVTNMRTRPLIKDTIITNKLGDIINSQPQYVSLPNFGYAEETYAAFRVAKESRMPMVYVGANDGMLHGFSAADGIERIAYVPSEMYRTRNSQQLLSKLTANDYGESPNDHQYYVDGSATVGDVCTIACAASTDWKTILVGGLNGGGQGIYALDITNPASFSESNASSIVMWEFNDTNDADLGYTYSRPAVVRLCTNRTNSSSTTPKSCDGGRWVVIFGNGYNNTEADGQRSTTGYAYLYVVDALTGALIKKIDTKTGSVGTPNGLATVGAIDVDNDNYVDYVYAGDLLGNMWKFDFSNQSDSNWDVAYGSASTPEPLYIAKDSTTSKNIQPITTAPDALIHPNGGVQVFFGTGSYITSADKTNTSIQSMYGIWDNAVKVPSTSRANLQQQTINTGTQTLCAKTNQADCEVGSTNVYRTVTANTVDWDTKKGWYTDLPDSGERITYDPRILGKAFGFTSTIPSGDICDYGGSSWDYFVDALTGGALGYSPFLGVPAATYTGSTTSAYASARKSEVGITPTGTLITQGKGRGTNIECGSTGNCDSYEVDLGKNVAGRMSWREILGD
ncbi:MAG: hypothetical protein H7315_16000 [Herminiimonas sp.]|nr:hypothetical protein [Herminiimonas sp.]